MEDLKLIIEKGPRQGETLEYTPRSIIKIGRVVRGNTIGIKDAGISSKHICIQFDNQLMKWTLIDLDSSNGTILNGQNLKSYVPSGLNDGDCIKIGELTSIIVKIGLQLSSEVEQNPRRQAKSGGGASVNSEMSGLGLGFDGDLGENVVVPKRSLRPRGKKAVDVKVEVESLSSKRNLRSSKKEVKECFVPSLNVISENLVVKEREDVAVVIEPKKTRGRRKKIIADLEEKAKPLEDPGLDGKKLMDIVVPTGDKRTSRGKKNLIVENVEDKDVEEDVQVDEDEAAVDKHLIDSLENVEISSLVVNLGTKNGSGQDHVADKEVVVGGSSVKGSSNVDKGKEVAKELEDEQEDDEGLVKETGPDNARWSVLTKMTLGDFFDYLEVQLPKEIYEKSEKIIADLEEKAQKCNEFRLQRNGNGKR